MLPLVAFQLICHSSDVWLLVMAIVSVTILADLSGWRRIVPLISIINPQILPYKGCVVPFFLTIN